MAFVVCIVNTPSGGAHEIEMEIGATVLHTKKELEKLSGIPYNEQRLVHNSIVLDNGITLSAELAGPEFKLDLLLVRMPPKSLTDIATDIGIVISQTEDVHKALRISANNGFGSACLEAVCHEWFVPGDHRDDRLQLLQNSFNHLVQGGLAEAFHEMVDMCDAGLLSPQSYVEPLRLAAKRGLILHCEIVLQSTGFQHASLRLESTPNDTSGNSKNCTPLHHAANDSILRILLRHEALHGVVNALDGKGSTCLHYATTEQACRMIIGCSGFSSVNVADCMEQTKLHMARNPGICRAILDDPSFDAIDARDSNGCTALHLACYSLDLVDVLLAARANINIMDDRGRTPLHRTRLRSVCHALLEAQADAKLKDNDGLTALSAASKMHHNDVVLALLESGLCQTEDARLALEHAHGLDTFVLEALCDASGVEPDSLFAQVEAGDEKVESDIAQTHKRWMCSVQ